VSRVDESRVAAAAERARGLPEGSVRGVLELGRSFPGGVSNALFHRAETELAGRLSGWSAAELSGDLGMRSRRRWTRLLGAVGVLALLTVAAGFGAPDRARTAWGPLLRPVEHLKAPAYPPLSVHPGDTVVARGAEAGIRVGAPMRHEVTVHWSSVGDVPRERSAAVVDGAAAAVVGPVGAPIRYWVTAPDGAVSDTFRIQPEDPLLIEGLAVDLIYPPHTGRPADHYEGSIPPLRVPVGTELRVAGRATAALEAAAIESEDGRSRPASVDDVRFGLEWRLGPDASGRWTWALAGRDGGRVRGADALDIAVIADRPPQVRITHPGTDTVMPASGRQPLMAEASDDYGIGTATLVFRRLSAGGAGGTDRRVDVPLEPAMRLTLRTLLDASDLTLLPGDAVEYHVVVRDRGSRPQSARSATYVLRVPGLAELRDQARRQAGELTAEAERLVEESRSLESATRDLSRRAAARRSSGGSGGSPAGDTGEGDRLAYEEARESGRLMERQQELADRIEAMQQELESLGDAAEEAGLTDPELQRRLRELASLYGELLSPELRDRLDALRDAVDSLDPEAVSAALEQLARAQEAFRERLEESLAVMRRAAAEQELNALAREAEEIAVRQQALADAMRQDAGLPIEDRPVEDRRPPPASGDPVAPPEGAGSSEPGETGAEAGPPEGGQEGQEENAAAGSPEAGETEAEAGEDDRAGESPDRLPQPPTLSPPRLGQQEELERRAGSLRRALQALQQRLLDAGEQGASSQTGAAREQGEASQRSMQRAADEGRSGEGASAASSAQEAATQMAEAARTLDGAGQQMAEAGREAAGDAVRQATQEALGLAQRQEALRREMERAEGQGRGGGSQTLQQMRSEQAALQQGLDQLGRNLSRTQERSSMLERQVGQSLERARANMERTLEGLQEDGAMPLQAAGRSVESLNQLAMSLLENDARMSQGGTPGSLDDALRSLSRLAQEQGALNSQMSALAPMQLRDEALTRQLAGAAARQRGIARRIGDISGMLGGREDVLGRLDQLSADAAGIARDLEGGRLEPETRARQERLFHRLLDAGRSLEREEYSDERTGERPEGVEVGAPAALDPALMDGGVRYPPPTSAQLRHLPPAYQRLILDYFDRLNAGPGPGSAAGNGASDPEDGSR
jgi:hypothetical protein